MKHTLYAGMFNTTDLIDTNVDTFIASLTEPYVEASQVANSIADMAGAVWGVKAGAPNEPDKVFLEISIHDAQWYCHKRQARRSI